LNLSRVFLVLIVAGAAAAGGYFSYKSLNNAEAQTAEDESAVDVRGKPLIGQPRPAYDLGSIDGSIVSASDFDGKVVLVNFWATWCAPCREEMPMLMALREEHQEEGLEIVGIAIDDVQRARDFVDELGIQYPNLVGSTDVMATMQLYGNVSGTLPYSVLVDRAGTVRWAKLGALVETELNAQIETLLTEN